MEEIISTRSLARGARVAAWNEAASRYLAPMEIAPVDATSFEGEMRRADLVSMRAFDVQCLGARVRRSAAHVTQSRDATFTLDLQVTGRSVIRQAGREVFLSPGDFVLLDGTRPHEAAFESPVLMRLLRFPAAVFRRFVGCPEDLVAIKVDGSQGNGLIASRFLAALFQGRNDQSVLGGVSHLERAALELIACAYAPLRRANTGTSSLAALHRVQIVEYIEDRLCDPSLTPASIARAMKMSLRYLHRLFNHETETVARYILRRRLERSAEQLADPLHAARQINALAYACGFASAAHFSRTFKQQFGMAPAEYRLHAERAPGQVQA
jgi:AraC-like DNA-binding protein